jgi:hypothetical protein
MRKSRKDWLWNQRFSFLLSEYFEIDVKIPGFLETNKQISNCFYFSFFSLSYVSLLEVFSRGAGRHGTAKIAAHIKKKKCFQTCGGGAARHGTVTARCGAVF